MAHLRHPVRLHFLDQPAPASRDGRSRHQSDDSNQHRFAEELDLGGNPDSGAGSTDARADSGADRPGPVHARHECAPRQLLDRRSLHIDQDVKQTARATDGEEGNCHERHGAQRHGDPKEGHANGDDEERPSKRTATPQPVQDRRRNDKPYEGSDGHAAEQQTDGRSVDPELDL